MKRGKKSTGKRERRLDKICDKYVREDGLRVFKEKIRKQMESIV